MHRWLGFEVKKDVLYCNACVVALCKKNYKRFHEEVDLVGNKEDLKKEFEKKKEEN